MAYKDRRTSHFYEASAKVTTVYGETSKFSADSHRNWQLSAIFSETFSQLNTSRNNKNCKYGETSKFITAGCSQSDAALNCYV